MTSKEVAVEVVFYRPIESMVAKADGVTVSLVVEFTGDERSSLLRKKPPVLQPGEVAMIAKAYAAQAKLWATMAARGLAIGQSDDGKGGRHSVAHGRKPRRRSCGRRWPRAASRSDSRTMGREADTSWACLRIPCPRHRAG